MKKKINALLASENGTLTINKYTTLSRWQIDALGDTVDKLEVVFSITSYADFRAEIKSRDLSGIVEEINEATEKAFKNASDAYIKNLKAGYLG